MRLTYDQIHRIIAELELLEHGELTIRVLGPGRPIEVRTTKSVQITAAVDGSTPAGVRSESTEFALGRGALEEPRRRGEDSA